MVLFVVKRFQRSKAWKSPPGLLNTKSLAYIVVDVQQSDPKQNLYKLE